MDKAGWQDCIFNSGRSISKSLSASACFSLSSASSITQLTCIDCIYWCYCIFILVLVGIDNPHDNYTISLQHNSHVAGHVSLVWPSIFSNSFRCLDVAYYALSLWYLWCIKWGDMKRLYPSWKKVSARYFSKLMTWLVH